MRFCHLMTVAVGSVSLACLNPSVVWAKDSHCAAAQSYTKVMNEKVPVEVDAMTNTTGADAQCGARTVRLNRTVALKQSRMESDFKDYLQKQDDDAFCQNKMSRAFIDAGWTWSVSYKFENGSPVVITVKCTKS